MFAKLRSILEIPDNKYTVRQISCWLWKALQGNRLQAVLNAGIGLLGVGLGLVSVWAMQRAIDTASGVRDGSILWAVGVMALLILGEFALGISRVWIRNILGVKAQNRMQQHILARLLRSEWRGREAMHSGDVINRLEDDVKTVVTFLTETLPSTLSTVAMFVGAFIYLFRMDIWLAVITVGILPLFISVSRIYMVYMRRYSRKVRDCDSMVQALLTETMQHRMLVKTMEADQQMLERLDTIQTTLHSWVRKRTIFSVGSNFFLNVGFSLGYLVAFLWGAFRLSAGTLTFGGMTAFLQLVSRIQGPARDLSRLLPAFVSVFTAAERLMELAEIPEEEQGDALVLSAPCGICFERVTFSYGAPGQQPVLQDATFDFPPGTCTAILGETGSGKTTLIRLLLALVRPQQGRIVIYSGLDKKVGEEQLLSPLHRCNFVYVPQGNTLLSGTLRENLLLGNPHATDEQMHEALRLACADFVDALPDGLDATFTEQGGGLSEGQAQRIAIARALLRPGSIMLLDEATSALDTETERKVLENILREKQRTVIFVTHRTAVVDYCDHTITFS
ncbi:MAG: ABC transporter ATP-binding protein/permease [Prevotella sp.]|nr:ABC transporter ATP-binding protein/permease [Prevotella sp.]